MLEIDIFPNADTFLRSLPPKRAEQILCKIEFLASNPHTPRSKLLEGFAPLRRFRSGDYRIIYLVTETLLSVVLIGKRNDDAIYRQLMRLFQ
jgi:mRNA interferase RelE/StbE